VIAAQPPRPSPVLQWVGLLGAPVAWGTQHILGIGLSLAQCNPSGEKWGLPLEALTLAVMGVAAALAAGSVLASFLVLRTMNRRDGDSEELPDARIRFLAVLGLTIGPLLLCIILMSGLGSALHGSCGQS
jgi:hypothetical protein